MQKRSRAVRPWLTFALGLGAALLPKCPLCVAGYLSIVGIGATAAGVLAPLFFPLGIVMMLSSAVSLALFCHASPLAKMIPQGGESATILPPSMARVQRCLTAFAFLISACGLIYDTSRLGPDRTSNADGGGDGSDAKPPRFCETLTPKVHFCADFDHGDIKEGWASFGLNPDPGIRNGGSSAQSLKSG